MQNQVHTDTYASPSRSLSACSLSWWGKGRTRGMGKEWALEVVGLISPKSPPMEEPGKLCLHQPWGPTEVNSPGITLGPLHLPLPRLHSASGSLSSELGCPPSHIQPQDTRAEDSHCLPQPHVPESSAQSPSLTLEPA